MVFINHVEMLEGRAAVVEIKGPLDEETSPDCEFYINQLLERSILYILVDAEKIEYVSAEGIGLILFLQKKVDEARGIFVIYNLPGEILQIYSILGFDKICRIAANRTEAMQIIDRQIELRENEEETALAGEEPGNAPAAPETQQQETVKEEDEQPAFSPLVIECRNCGAFIRVKKSGTFMCPDCSTEFTVGNDHSVDFHL